MGSKRIVVAILSLILTITLIFREDTSGGLSPQNEEMQSRVPDTAAPSEIEIENFVNQQSENRSMHWFYSDTIEKPKGVALVIHGLNLRPERMQPVISTLTDSGIDVLSLSLRGHGENFSRNKGVGIDLARLDALKNVSYPIWMNEAYLAYLQLKIRAEEKRVPLFLTAFSLGGLIGLDLFASNADVRFDRMVLFAPAIRLHATIFLERLLSPFPRLVIPSMAPEAYLANHKGTPIAAYNALFDSLAHFDKHAGYKLNVSTLVFIDQRDEFIPLGKLKRLIKEKEWDHWRFYTVEKDETAQEDSFYHHIIDASSTGKTTWQEMMNAMAQHLMDQTP